MNETHEFEEKAQKYAMYRARECLEKNGFNPVQSSVLKHVYYLSLEAIREEVKLLAFIACETWCVEIKEVQENLLRSEIYDK